MNHEAPGGHKITFRLVFFINIMQTTMRIHLKVLRNTSCPEVRDCMEIIWWC